MHKKSPQVPISGTRGYKNERLEPAVLHAFFVLIYNDIIFKKSAVALPIHNSLTRKMQTSTFSTREGFPETTAANHKINRAAEIKLAIASILILAPHDLPPIDGEMNSETIQTLAYLNYLVNSKFLCYYKAMYRCH